MVSGTANGAPGTMTVRGQAPMSELLDYQSRLNALTSGQGRYTIEFSHYESVPANTQAEARRRVPGARRRLIRRRRAGGEELADEAT
jgi:translation elongation factor EF-G